MKKMCGVLVFICMLITITSCQKTGEPIVRVDDIDVNTPIDELSTKKPETDPQSDNPDSDICVPDNSSSENTSDLAGGLTVCEIHSLDFHTFTDKLIKYVGEERFDKWFYSCEEKDSGIENCIHYANIYRCIQEFGIPREAFEKLYYETDMFYFSDHNVDVLYNSNEDAVNEYYMSYADREEEREKYSSLGEIKYGIMYYTMTSSNKAMQDFFEKHCKNHSIAEWSISDFVNETSIKKPELKALINDITVRKYPGMTVVLKCFDFNYDAIYGASQNNPEENETKMTVIDKHNADMLFCNQPQLKIDIVKENISAD